MSEARRSGFLGSERSRLIAALAFVTGLLIAAVIMLIVSRTTFAAQTATGTNTWSTGTVVLTLRSLGNGCYQIINRGSGLAMDGHGITTYLDDQAFTYLEPSDPGNTNQQYSIIPVA